MAKLDGLEEVLEHDFSTLKRARMYAPPGTSLDEIIRNYRDRITILCQRFNFDTLAE